MPRNFLNQVLGQGEHIQELIEQSAEELSSVNAAIKRDFPNRDIPADLRHAFARNEAVATKLRRVLEELRIVDQRLQVEIRDRTLVDHQLAAAVEQEEGARFAALHDDLTGLPNRVLFGDRLEHGIAHAKRHRWILAVLFVDLDNFKNINDTYGHQAGDAVLQAVATRLDRNTRNDDTVSRFGGDEFVCLLTPLHEEKDIAVIAAKIRKAIQAPCEVRVGDDIVSLILEASIGISVFPKDGASAAVLIARADEAMYEAKANRTGAAFAQEEAAHFECVAAHRQPMAGGVVFQDASRVLDVESSANNRPLPRKGRQKVRTH